MALSKKRRYDALPVRAIDSWYDIPKLLAHCSLFRNRGWLFRGVCRGDFDLIPKIGRSDARKWKPDSGIHMPYQLKDERAVLRLFQDRAPPLLRFQPRHELEWLAVAQHYGVPTRLLDWTENILVASWFACEQYLERVSPVEARVKGLLTRSNRQRPEAKLAPDPAIWITCDVQHISSAEERAPFKIRSPRSYRPPFVSERIASQGSILTIHGDPRKPFKPDVVFRVPIAKSACFTILKRLDAAGYNFSTVFPDAGGLGVYLNWRYKNVWLPNYKRLTIDESKDR
ncbi:FRG domain-containing protein [Usitatibacter rugosus]|uniref:FRG domain-containing protein n=1 Tax=Usitatibacter rugosus TaxID=2732067 RepID=UPI001489B94A